MMSSSLGGGGPTGWSIFCKFLVSVIDYQEDAFLIQHWIATYPNHLNAKLCYRLILGQGHVRQQWWVSDDARVGVAMDVGLPLPARCIGMSRANVLGLQALQLLLVAQFVRLVVSLRLAYFFFP